MCGPDSHPKSRRGLYALLGLLALLALLITTTGGLYLMTSHVQPDAAKPLSETGGLLLCFGSLNLLLLYNLFWQLRSSSKPTPPADKP